MEYRDIKKGKLSDSTWRKIIKDFNIPISHVNHEISADQICTADLAGLKQGTEIGFKWVCFFLDETSAQQEAFLGLTRDVMEQMISGITASSSYSQAFNQMDLQTVFPLIRTNIHSGDVYVRPNIGKRFISIDLKEAAFVTFKHWDSIVETLDLRWTKDGKTILPKEETPKILPEGADTYYLWVKHTIDDISAKYAIDTQLTENNPSKAELLENVYMRLKLAEYICDSKQMRQVIFGKTNPKRIQHVEKYLVQQMVEYINNETGIYPVCLNNDEAIYEYDEAIEKLQANAEFWRADSIWHFTVFTLDAYQMKQSVPGVGTFNGPLVYVKEKTTYEGDNTINSYGFKCLPSRFALGFEQLYRESKGIGKPKYRFIKSHVSNTFFEAPVLNDGFVTFIAGSGIAEWSIEKVN